MQIFNLFHRFVIFKIDLSHFLLYMIALFLLQIIFWRMIIFVQWHKTQHCVYWLWCLLADSNYLLIWKNVYHQLEKNWLKSAWMKNLIRLCSMSYCFYILKYIDYKETVFVYLSACLWDCFPQASCTNAWLMTVNLCLYQITIEN